MHDGDDAWGSVIDQPGLPQTWRKGQLDTLLFSPSHGSARLLGGEGHDETTAHILLDRLPLSHRLGNSRAPGEFDGERRRVGITRQWLRRFAEPSVKPLPECGDANGVWFGTYAWRETAQLCEESDGCRTVRLGDGLDVGCSLVGHTLRSALA
jgi:hypothetical protein